MTRLAKRKGAGVEVGRRERMLGKILVVENKFAVRDVVEPALAREGFEVETVTNGEMALRRLRSGDQFNLALVDTNLPGMDGITFCRELRARGEAQADIPVVLLDEHDKEGNIVAGLEAGADDYVTGPFGPRELVSRVRARLRRHLMDSKGSGRTFEFPGLLIDGPRWRVLVRGKSVAFTLKEFELLTFLASRAGQVCSRAQISHHLWGEQSSRRTRAVDVHIQHIRKKIEPDPKNPRYIQTVRGIGYRFAEI